MPQSTIPASVSTAAAAAVPQARSKAGQQLISGAVSGFAAAVALQPLDVLKTRLQQSDYSKNKRSILSVAKGVVQEDGVVGLWRGTVPTLLRNVPGVALYFTSLQSLRSYLSSAGFFRPTPSPSLRPLPTAAPSSSSELAKLSAQGNLISGALARTAVGFILNPFTVCKARFESNVYHYTSLPHAFKDIVRDAGFRGLFAGFTASALRDAPYAGLYVVIYEAAKEYGSALVWRGESVPLPAVHSASGIAAGTLATVVTHPFDVIKTKMQLFPHEYPSLTKSTLQLLRTSPRVLWAGSSIRIARKALSSAIGWTTFESLVRLLRSS